MKQVLISGSAEEQVTEFKKVAILSRRGKVLVEPMKKLAEIFTKTGREVLLEHEAAEVLGFEKGYTLPEIGKLADLAVILGGDGTMLGICRKLVSFRVPVIGINAGHLGFITDICFDNMESEIKEVLDGHYFIDSRIFLKADQVRDGKTIYSGIALNEICVSRGISGGMIDFSVAVNKLQLSAQRADGIIFSTPTGSTAYALSVGGPLIAPTVPCILMISVAPHTLSNRPLILAQESLIELDILDIRDAGLYYDMQDFTEVKVGDKIVIKPYEHPLHILHPRSHNFFDTINRKLHWNLMPTTRTPS